MRNEYVGTMSEAFCRDCNFTLKSKDEGNRVRWMACEHALHLSHVIDFSVTTKRTLWGRESE